MERFTGLLGLLTMLGLAFAFSTNRRAIRGKTRARNPRVRNPGSVKNKVQPTTKKGPDGTVAKALNSRYYAPTDRPGARFPHMWLDSARKHSTLDWFDKEFAVVAGPLGNEWLEAGRQVSEKAGVALSLKQLPAVDPADGFQLGMRGAVLVRPDGHVAWRMPWLPSDPAKELAGALSTLLH